PDEALVDMDKIWQEEPVSFAAESALKNRDRGGGAEEHPVRWDIGLERRASRAARAPPPAHPQVHTASAGTQRRRPTGEDKHWEGRACTSTNSFSVSGRIWPARYSSSAASCVTSAASTRGGRCRARCCTTRARIASAICSFTSAFCRCSSGT